MTRRIALLLLMWLAGLAAMHAQWDGAVLQNVSQNTVQDFIAFKQAFALDAQAGVHVVYASDLGGGPRVFYRRKQANAPWEDAIQLSTTGLPAAGAVIAIRPDDQLPVVAWSEGQGAGSEIRLAWFTSPDAWLDISVTENEQLDISPTLATDADGRWHLAWITEAQPGLYHIAYGRQLDADPSNFETEVLAESELGEFGTGAEPFLAFDPESGVYVGYRAGGYPNYRIDIAHKPSPAEPWSFLTAPSGNLTDYQCALVARHGKLHVLVSGNDGWGIGGAGFYSTWENGSWSAPQQVNSQTAQVNASLFIDGAGAAHCVWETLSGNFLTGDIWYSTNADGSWTSQPLQEEGELHYPLMALDHLGNGYMLALKDDVFTYDPNLVEVVLYGPELVVGTEAPAWAADLRLSPNPASGLAWLDLPDAAGDCHITLTDQLGRTCLQLEGRGRVRLALGHLPKGIYCLRVRTREGVVAVRRLVVQ